MLTTKSYVGIEHDKSAVNALNIVHDTKQQ